MISVEFKRLHLCLVRSCLERSWHLSQGYLELTGTGFERYKKWILEGTPDSVLRDWEGAGAEAGPHCTPVWWPGLGPCPACGSVETAVGSV